MPRSSRVAQGSFQVTWSSPASRLPSQKVQEGGIQSRPNSSSHPTQLWQEDWREVEDRLGQRTAVRSVKMGKKSQCGRIRPFLPSTVAKACMLFNSGDPSACTFSALISYPWSLLVAKMGQCPAKLLQHPNTPVLLTSCFT